MPLSEQQLRALGLDPRQVNDDWASASVSDGTGEGLSFAEALTLTAVLAGQATMRPVDLHPAATLQVVVERPRGGAKILRLTATEGTTLTVSGDRVSVESVPGEPWKTAVRFEPNQPFRVDVGPAAGMVVVAQGDELSGSTFSGFVLDVPPPPTIESAVASWCADNDDEWLSGTIAELLGGRGAWGHLAAAGVYARLSDGSDSRPLRWAMMLSDDQRTHAEQLTAAGVQMLRGDLFGLEETYVPTEPAWLYALLDLCWRRDDVEGVRILLRASGPTEALDRALQALDERARLFVSSLPLMPQFESERLIRVAQRCPGAWWGSLAAGM